MPVKVSLSDPAAADLVALTNAQFEYWAINIRKLSKCPIPAGNNMNLWFVLARLAIERENKYSILKSDIFNEIPNLKFDAAKKHVTFLHRAGFIETVKQDGPLYVRLTDLGVTLMQNTLSHWAQKFGDVQKQLIAS